jgi:hypothetical protein
MCRYPSAENGRGHCLDVVGVRIYGILELTEFKLKVDPLTSGEDLGGANDKKLY